VRHVALSLLVLAAVHSSPARAAGAEKSVQRLAPTLGCDRLTSAEGLPNSNVKVVLQDKLGFIWLGTQEGLVRYDGIQMRVYRPVENDPRSISSGYITALTLDASGKLWVGTAENGVNLYDPSTDQFTRFARGTAAGTLSSEGVTAIVRDRKDRIWLAMSGGGLNRFEPESGTFVKYLAKPLDAAITSLDVDAAGNLWLATASEGIMRWNPDGSAQVARPTPEDDRGTGAAPLTTIRVMSSGKVWIGSDGDGLLSFDPKTNKFVRLHHDPDNQGTITDDHISSLFEDKAKNLWIGTTSGLNRLDPSGRVVRYQQDRNDPTSLAFPEVESIYQDAGGVMWVGGFTVGLCKFDEFRLKFGHHRIRNHATALVEDPDGTLWVGTYGGGLYKYERAAQRATLFLELNQHAGGNEEPIGLEAGSWISALHRDRRGTLWIALKGRGLVGFDTRTEKYKHYMPDPRNPASLPVDSLFDLWEDEQGMLWLATWGSGLVRFDPQQEIFTAFTTENASGPNGITSNHIYKIYADPTNKKVLWLGTGKGGLVRFDISSSSATSFRHKEDDPASLSNDDVTSIYRDKAGIIWAGTYGGGLNRVDPTTGKAERFTAASSGLSNDIILAITADADEKLWMSTNGGGLVQFDPKTRKFQVYDASDGVQDNEFSQGAVLRAKSGELFFGGAGGFNAFFPREIKRDPYVPPVVVTAFKVFNQEVKLDRPIWTLPPLEVSYSDSFEIQFAALAFAAPGKNRYAYKLEGFDDDFIETNRPFATYTKLGGGKYTLRVRAANRHGVWNEAGVALKLVATPPIWRTWRAYGVYLLVLAGAVYLLFRYQQQRLQRAEREGRLAVVERDLELTGAVQTGFLPENNQIVTPRVQLFGVYRPADACGGDWWWHEPLSGGRHVVMVGDVTGHGPGPAMVTAAVATAFRVMIERGLDDVQEALEMLNREVLRVAKGKYHMTMAAFEIEEETGRWVLFSAGAPPILTLGQSGKHKVHFCAGAPLGTETGFETGRVEGQLESGDRILIYTDGIPEIALPNGGVFGMRRFAQLFERTREHALKDATTAILVHADQASGGQRQADDWTFTMIEWG
jgi:ligand-binding sensor domain-containing protein/serine phosphatase RsbU (regulator of sigma subunit)